MQFRNRREAGRLLALHLSKFAGRDDVIVLALPRGGVPVGFEVARALGVPLDVWVVRKLGTPGHEELAMGAIGPGGVRVLNEAVVAQIADAGAAIDRVTTAETKELERRERDYRDGRPKLELRGKVVILVDDGLATGASMRAAVAAVRSSGVARCVVAVPVAAPETCDEFERIADEIICPSTPPDFAAVGQFYSDFSQTSDSEVRALLGESQERERAGSESELHAAEDHRPF